MENKFTVKRAKANKPGYVVIQVVYEKTGKIYTFVRKDYMADNRKKINNIKDYILDIKEYDDILDEVIALLSSRAEIISDVSGYNKGMVFIALQEMVTNIKLRFKEDTTMTNKEEI